MPGCPIALALCDSPMDIFLLTDAPCRRVRGHRRGLLRDKTTDFREQARHAAARGDAGRVS
jgi:hypothetical protein